MAELLPSEDLVDEASDFGHLKPGTRLGRYELLVPVARGGMARVWAARLVGQRGFQKLVAIKTILPHLACEPEFERMFLDEARIASGVHHPNVCEIHELGEENRTLYLVMEWVNGDSFARVLRPTGRNEAMDPRVVARINILITADGFSKVCDFGVAKALGQLHEATSAGQLKGKVAYMAPEQVTGGSVDRRSDVFALGVVLYEATTGMRPFRGDGEAQVMHQLLKGEFDAPSTIIRNYPPELERIVSRALSHQPILRYPTAERMRFALEEFLAKGQLVTQSNVAQVMKARIGESLDKRKERIKQASTVGEGGVIHEGAQMTPSNQDAQRSGVKQAPARPLFTTLQMNRPPNMPPMGPPQASPPPGAPTLVDPAAAHPLSSTIAMANAPVMPPTGYTPPTPPVVTIPPNVSLAPNSAPGYVAQSFEPAPMPTPQAPAGAGSYALAAGVGVLLAAIIGGGGYYVWHRKHAEPPPLIAQPTPMNQSAATPTSDIALRVTPPDATIVVDGVELAPGTKNVPRPPAGKMVTVVARAKGFDDATVLVDYYTKSPMDIPLRSQAVTIELPDNPTPPPAADPPQGNTGAAPPPPTPDRPPDQPTTKPRPKPRDPGIPANPY
jgi:serine/threonine-protein kinase